MKVLILVISLITGSYIYAQVAINKDGSVANNSAMLDVKSTDGGLLIPRLSKTQRDAIYLPATGLMIYQINYTPGFYYFNGTEWVKVGAETFSINDLYDGRTGGNSVFLGSGAGTNDDLSDNQNTFIGYNAGTLNNSGFLNTATGYMALHSNTAGYKNIASGPYTMYSNSSGNFNTAIGYSALYSNTEGFRNIAIGYESLYSNISGYNNSAIGPHCLYYNMTGERNTASGYGSLYYNNGVSNTATGVQSLFYNTTGNQNTAFGIFSLFSNTTGNNNTALGCRAFYSGQDFNNSTAIGYYSDISASNQVRIGNNSVTSIGGYANWTNVSDARFKKDIKENVKGLDFIMKLRPVTYHLDMEAIADLTKIPDSLRLPEAEKLKGQILQTGFIAQEVEKAAHSLGYDFSGVDAPKNDKDFYGLRYAEFVVPLVKAIQEQQSIIVELTKENISQKNKIEKLELNMRNLEKSLFNNLKNSTK